MFIRYAGCEFRYADISFCIFNQTLHLWCTYLPEQMVPEDVGVDIPRDEGKRILKEKTVWKLS